MTAKKFTDFTELQTPTSGVYFVGVKEDASEEIRIRGDKLIDIVSGQLPQTDFTTFASETGVTTGTWFAGIKSDESEQVKIRGDSLVSFISGQLPSQTSSYIFVSGNYQAVAGDKIAADTSAGSFTITLPANPNNGDIIEIVPAKGYFYRYDWPTEYGNILTVARSGNNINNSASDFTLKGSISAQIIFISGYGWRTFASSLSFNSVGGVSIAPFLAIGALPDVNIHDNYWNSGPAGEAKAGDILLVAGPYDSRGPCIRGSNSDIILSQGGILLGNNAGFMGSTVLMVNPSQGGNSSLVRCLAPLELISYSPGTPATDSARLFTKDINGTTCLHTINEASNIQPVGGIVLTKTTTGNTNANLALDDGSAQFTIDNNTFVTGIVTVIGSRSDGANYASFVRKFSIKRIGGICSLAGDIETIGSDIGSSEAVVTITADNTLKVLKIVVFPGENTTWKWRAVIDNLNILTL